MGHSLCRMIGIGFVKVNKCVVVSSGSTKKNQERALLAATGHLRSITLSDVPITSKNVGQEFSLANQFSNLVMEVVPPGP